MSKRLERVRRECRRWVRDRLCEKLEDGRGTVGERVGGRGREITREERKGVGGW